MENNTLKASDASDFSAEVPADMVTPGEVNWLYTTVVSTFKRSSNTLPQKPVDKMLGADRC